MSSGKWRPFSLGLNMLTIHINWVLFKLSQVGRLKYCILAFSVIFNRRVGFWVRNLIQNLHFRDPMVQNTDSGQRNIFECNWILLPVEWSNYDIGSKGKLHLSPFQTLHSISISETKLRLSNAAKLQNDLKTHQKHLVSRFLETWQSTILPAIEITSGCLHNGFPSLYRHMSIMPFQITAIRPFVQQLAQANIKMSFVRGIQ